MCPLVSAVADRRFLPWALAWTAAALLAFGFVSAIIPNPVFGRSVAPEPFAIAVWLVSAPLMGLLAATYTVPARSGATPMAPVPAAGLLAEPLPAPAVTASMTRSDGSVVGTVAGFGAFLAIGCPLCNKVVLIALGASGAMSIWAPIQPILGAASVALLAATVAWRLRRRAAGDVCAVPARTGRSA
jgi:hypothetical protein